MAIISLWIMLACIIGCTSLQPAQKPPLSFSQCRPMELDTIRALLIMNSNKDSAPRFICLICGHESTRKSSLVNHINKIHPVIEYLDPDGNVRFMCYYCKEIRSKKSSITTHQSRNHPDRLPNNPSFPQRALRSSQST